MAWIFGIALVVLVFLGWFFKDQYTRLFRSAVKLLVRFIPPGVKPDHITSLALVVSAAGVVLAAFRWYIPAALVFFIGALLDVADGEFARRGRRVNNAGQSVDLSTPRGKFYDSNSDRPTEAAMLIVFLVQLAIQGNIIGAAFAGIGIFAAGWVPYIKSTAELAGVEKDNAKLGTRAERIAAILFTLVSAQYIGLQWGVYVYAIASTVAALWRFGSSYRQIPEEA
jgi:phosphatidylglycerophosphate synthase